MVINKRLVTIILAVVVGVVAYFFYHTAKLRADGDSWRSAYEASNETATVWKNKAGESQAEIKNAHVTISVLKQQQGKDIQDLREAQKTISGLKKDLSNLQSSTSVSVSTIDTIITILRDTIIINGQPARAFAYSDKWTKLNGYFLRDSVHVNLKVDDDLQVVQFWRRPGFLKSRELYTDVISKNPHSEVTKLKTTSVRQPVKSRFVIVAFAGVDITIQPSFGIGVGYKLFEF